MFKFRTMKKDSHIERDQLQDLNEHSGPLFKIQDDPRIIKGTKILKSYQSVDKNQLSLNFTGKTLN